jgi:hypothetical protein
MCPHAAVRGSLTSQLAARASVLVLVSCVAMDVVGGVAVIAAVVRSLIQAMLLVHELFLHALTLFQKNSSWTPTFFILEVVLALTFGWLVIPTAVVLLVGVLLFAFLRRRDEGKKRKQLVVLVPQLRLTRSEDTHTHTHFRTHPHIHTHTLTHSHMHMHTHIRTH